jgi:hypothetical protein
MNVFADEIFGTQQTCPADRYAYVKIDERRAGRKIAEYGIEQIKAKAFDGGPVFYVEVGTHDATLLAALGKTAYSPWLAYDMLVLGDDAEHIGTTVTAHTVEAADSAIAEHLTWPTVDDVTTQPSHEIGGDFTADEWAALGVEIGAAKSGLVAADADPSVVADLSGSEPMVRLGSLSIRGNPMRPRRRG